MLFLQDRPEGTTAGTFPEVVEWSDAVILATASLHETSDMQALAESLKPSIAGKVGVLPNSVHVLKEFSHNSAVFDVVVEVVPLFQQSLTEYVAGIPMALEKSSLHQCCLQLLNIH